MTACGAIGALIVGGRVVGQVRCELDAGHIEAGESFDKIVGYVSGKTAHRVTLAWTPEAEPDLDLFDPAERFDVEVEIPAGAPDDHLDGRSDP